MSEEKTWLSLNELGEITGSRRHLPKWLEGVPTKPWGKFVLYEESAALEAIAAHQRSPRKGPSLGEQADKLVAMCQRLLDENQTLRSELEKYLAFHSKLEELEDKGLLVLKNNETES